MEFIGEKSDPKRSSRKTWISQWQGTTTSDMKDRVKNHTDAEDKPMKW